MDNIDQRLKRYESAMQERQLKISKFTQAYRMAFPTHAKWLIHGKGSESYDKTNFRWDTTAVQGLKTFSSNIQSLLMPSFKKWARFIASAEYDSNVKQDIDAMVEPTSDLLFRALDSSNLMLESNIAFQDMGIAVGLLQIHATGNRNQPIRFQSIPMHTVALGQFEGRIEDVYRKFKLPARDIKSMWKDATLTDSIINNIKSDPSTEIELLEGTIYYPDESSGQKYCYFVMDMESKKDIVYRKQAISRWIPFRFAVSPGEVWGEGPILQILDTIRIANKIVEMDLLNAGLKISRPLFVNGSKVLNPNNIKMEPGSIIHVNDTAPGQLPIVPLDIAGDFNFDQVTLHSYQSEIRDALFADPLGPAERPNQSATETSIRQQNWIKKSSSSIGRLSNELLRPLILKSCVLMQEQGFMPKDFHIDPYTLNMTIKGMNLDIDFLSPLASLEDQKEAQNFLQFNQEMQSIMGPELSIAALNMEKVPQYLADKMNVKSSLVKNSQEIQAIQQEAAQTQHQMMEQQQAEQIQKGSQSNNRTDLPQLNLQ